MNAELLTFAETAQRLGVGVLTVRQWVRTEQCPVIREGRRVRIPAAWVDDRIEVTR
jgi:excisionase family DNA binding protein